MNILKYFIVFSALVTLSSCNYWLDIQPVDTTTETTLFETGDGYRNALNGIYRQISVSSVYGKVLSWGELDAMAQIYNMKDLPGRAETYFSSYEYSSMDAVGTVQTVWSTIYNSIANCNNIIQRIEKESPTKFAKGEEEMKLIHGEALALRAFLHFEILRLFAPYVDINDMDDSRNSIKNIPYVTTYPCTFQEYSTNKEILEKIRIDLLQAKQLVGVFDIPRKLWFQTSVRFENNHQQLQEKPTDLFFAYRGYRLNYYAICGLLSRAYLYSGMYKEAYDETEDIIKLSSKDSPSEYYRIFKFSAYYSVPADGNSKFYDDILFCLSNQKLEENYKNYRTDAKLYLNASDPKKDWYGGESSDVRAKQITIEGGSKYYCNKNLNPGTGSKFQYAKDMLPMIRLSELYLTRAEYYYRLGNNEAAATEIKKITEARGCYSNVDTSPANWFTTTILSEARKEFLGEGQLFHYYKRFNIKPTGMVGEKQFYFPLPDNESF